MSRLQIHIEASDSVSDNLVFTSIFLPTVLRLRFRFHLRFRRKWKLITHPQTFYSAFCFWRKCIQVVTKNYDTCERVRTTNQPTNQLTNQPTKQINKQTSYISSNLVIHSWATRLLQVHKPKAILSLASRQICGFQCWKTFLMDFKITEIIPV